jgi:hypothetical protein
VLADFALAYKDSLISACHGRAGDIEHPPTSAASAAFLLASSSCDALWGAVVVEPSFRGGPPTLLGTEEDWFCIEGLLAGRGRAFSVVGSGAASLPQRLPMVEGHGGEGGMAEDGLRWGRGAWN